MGLVGMAAGKVAPAGRRTRKTGWRSYLRGKLREGVHRATLALVALLILAAQDVAPLQAADVFAGQIVYQAHCVSCHGIDGRPVLPGTPDLRRGEGLFAPDNVLVPTMKAGKGVMPGFEHILSEREILDVLAYSRTLQR